MKVNACVAVAIVAGVLIAGARPAHTAMAANTPTYPPSYYVPRPTYYYPPFSPSSDAGYGTYWLPDRPAVNSSARRRPRHPAPVHPQH